MTGEKQDGRTTLREIFTATRATAAGELTDAEFRFWMMVRSLEGADRGCYADTEYMVTLLRRSESHVKKVRPSLVRKGWLNVIQRGPKNPELRAVLPVKGVHGHEPLGVHQDEPLPLASKKGVHKGVHSQELSPTPPIEESTGSTEKTLEREISEKRARYSPEQLVVIDSAIADFRSTRKTGLIADSVILAEFAWWKGHPVDHVVEGLRIYVEKHFATDGKRESYARGIIRNCDDARIARRPPPKKSDFPDMDTRKAAFLAARRTQSEELSR